MKIEEGKTYRGLINGCLIKITEIKVETGVFKDTVVAHYIDLKSNRRGADTLSHMGIIYKWKNIRRNNSMKKLIYKLTYPDGFTRLTEVRANIPVDTLKKVQDAWKNLNIQADLVNIE